jgi:hypothetical protein
MQGSYCHVCGQKNILEEDRRFRHLIELFLAELFSLDGKFWRTLKGIFKPGFLAREYLCGRRSPYLSPVSIFLLVNVLYFVFPVLSDFDLPFSDQVPGRISAQLEQFKHASPERLERMKKSDGQLHSQWTAPWIEKRLAQRKALNPDYRLDTMANDFNAKSGEISKLLIIVHVPFLAFALMLMFWRSGKYFAEHFVVALITFSSVLLMIQIIFPVLTILPLDELLTARMIKITGWIMVTVLTALLAAALQRVYTYSYWYCALCALGFLFVLVLANTTVYRGIQFAIIFMMI